MSNATTGAPSVKVCTKCGESKPVTEYHKQKKASDGLRPACKACTNAQNRSVYRKNKPAHLEAKRRYRAENPASRLETVRKYDAEHSEMRRAHWAVKRAIRLGDLPPIAEQVCSICGRQAAVYHHESYERERWLDVKPLCRVCHGKEHRAE